ncbi:MAG TPA: hypothetical protein VES20_15890, partial [Bryobacteraceae bacterium]|nr:hypothetical protein [Bryobacteraceae bacterium]
MNALPFRVIASLVILVWLRLGASQAATFYVDSVAGADALDGKSVGTAWKTLARASTNPLAAGDVLLLKRGSVWLETLELTASGSLSAPITIGAYGTGVARPVIEGGGTRQYNIVTANCQFIKITDLELRGSTLMPLSLLEEGLSLHNVSVSDGATPATVLNVSPSKRWHGAWFLGLYSDSAAATNRFANTTGANPAVVHVFVPWASPWGTEAFDSWLMDGIAAGGALPMVSWEPMDWGNSNSADPVFSL